MSGHDLLEPCPAVGGEREQDIASRLRIGIAIHQALVGKSVDPHADRSRGEPELLGQAALRHLGALVLEAGKGDEHGEVGRRESEPGIHGSQLVVEMGTNQRKPGDHRYGRHVEVRARFSPGRKQRVNGVAGRALSITPSRRGTHTGNLQKKSTEPQWLDSNIDTVPRHAGSAEWRRPR
jgi:hypothetical protein